MRFYAALAYGTIVASPSEVSNLDYDAITTELGWTQRQPDSHSCLVAVRFGFNSKGMGKARIAAGSKLGTRLWIMMSDQINYQEFYRRERLRRVGKLTRECLISTAVLPCWGWVK